MAITRRSVEIFLSQRIEAASKAALQDISQQFPHSDRWIASLFVSNIFIIAVPPENLPVALQFLRRTENSLRAYAALIGCIKELSEDQSAWKPYSIGLTQAEIAISSLYQARYLASKKFGLKQFEKRDGSDIQRLNELYNSIKHVPANDNESVWLSESAIECATGKLSYTEFEEILGRTAGLAQAISGIEQ